MNTIEIKLVRHTKTSMKLEHNKFNIIVDRPISKGGNEEGLMGGQYLLTGIGGCFCSNLLAAANTREFPLENLQVKVTADISETPPQYFSSITIDVYCSNTSNKDQITKLIKIAERACIAINTIKKGIDIKLKLH
ncbi:MAG: OsmC family protein [Crocinitomicaceae bacterium]|nr:OsmC family protein [Crocinitomicaceae bacterium]